MVCPECNQEEVNVEEKLSLMNVLVGIATGTGIAASFNYSIGDVSLTAIPAIGMLCYFYNFPLGLDKNYTCRECRNEWSYD